MSTIQSLIRRFNANNNYYKSTRYNETETRREFIDPFFKLLGWDIDNSRGVNPRLREVMPENYQGDAGRPDYSFTLSGVSKFFVEAKKPFVRIVTDMESIFQARSYGWSAGHLIVVLTNFEYLLIYDCTIPPNISDNPNKALLKKYHYTEYEEKFDEIKSFISRETVYSGQFERQFEPLLHTGARLSVDEYFLKQINSWRVRLANYLHKAQPTQSLAFINDITQTFINQMVFLRICEDRNLPLYHNLQKSLEDVTELKLSLQKIFEEADRKYNSGLFNGDYIIFDLSNDIIMDMIKNLYYPQSPYAFNVIESNLLGQIYEMFLCERLILRNGRVELSQKVENLNRDIVTTPVEIVKQMVQKALEPKISGKAPEEILRIRIADIACGSGIFLVEVFEYLIQYYIHWYMENNPSHLIPCGNGHFNIPFEEKRNILTHCIYGVDIDPNAVEVAKFSLLLKLLENETTPSLGDGMSLLPNLDNNIKAGNSLVDFRSLRVQSISRETLEKIFPFDWQFANGVNSFDVIIGNPPYVTTEDMINLLPREEFAIYKKYKVAYKQFDKYFVFIERGFKKLNDDGILCFIVPNKFTNNKSGEKLRELFGKYVYEFIDFGAAQIFKDRTIYSSILVLRKTRQQYFILEKVTDLQEWWAKQEAPCAEFERVRLNTDILTKNAWMLVTDRRKADLIAKLYKNSIHMKKVADPINGIQTSAERPRPIYWFSTSEISRETDDYYEIRRDGKAYKIEKAILKPFFKPTVRDERNISTFDLIQTNKWIIFPYNEEGELYNPEEMASCFGNTWKYLNDNYERLIPKQISGRKGDRDVPHATAETWYHYGRIQHLTSFINTPKIIVRVLHDRQRSLYAYDENDILIAAGGTAGYCAIKKLNGGYELEYILAILDHPAIEWLCSILGSDFRGNFYSTGTYILDILPVRKIDLRNQQQSEAYYRIINAARRIHTINKELLDRNLAAKQKILLLNEKVMLRTSIRNEITALYDIEGYEDIIG